MELPLSPAGRRYGYRRDAPDYRDFGAMRLEAPFTVPALVDLEGYCGPVRDQGSLGACTAFAGCGMREFLARRYESESEVFSPLFLYYKERELDGVLDQGDTGSTGRTSVRVMNEFGICLEADDAYSVEQLSVAPNVNQKAEALRYKGGAYHRLLGISDMRECLASGYVFVVGFTVYESFEIGHWTVMPMPKHGERELGGHEVLFIGYNDATQMFKVRNSWGAQWGENGNFYFPYAAASDPKILQDAWIQHLGNAWK